MQLLTPFPLLKALGWALFNSLWQMAFLWLLYTLLSSIFTLSAARVRHGLALILLTVGTVWWAMTFLSLWLFPDSEVHMPWLAFLSPAQSAPGWFWQTCRSFLDGVLSYGSTLYLLILCGLFVRYSNHYWHSRNLTRRGLFAMPPEYRTFVTATRYQLGIRATVRTWQSSLVDTPLTLGFLKPVILLPVAMINHLTSQQVEAILVHELAHIRRKDYLLHLLVTVLEGLFFFNPFSRLLINQLKKEREHCCDDLVLQFKYDPHAYVSALLSLAARSQHERQIALAATGEGNRLLLQRAKRILLQKRDRQRPGTRFLLLLLFALLMTAATLYPSLHPAKMNTPIVAGRLFNVSRMIAAARLVTPARRGRAASFRETSLILLPDIHASAARPHRPARRVAQPVASEDDLIQPEDNTAEIVNTVADDDLEGTAASTDQPVPNSAGEGLSTRGGKSPDGFSRDYSLDAPATIAGASDVRPDGSPFVPNSSFSFQYTVDDSSRPAEKLEKLIYLQESGRQEIMAAMNKLNQQLAQQLKALASLQVKAEESVQLRRQLQTRQLKLQQDYLRKMTGWQKKLEKTTHVRMIVYI